MRSGNNERTIPRCFKFFLNADEGNFFYRLVAKYVCRYVSTISVSSRSVDMIAVGDMSDFIRTSPIRHLQKLKNIARKQSHCIETLLRKNLSNVILINVVYLGTNCGSRFGVPTAGMFRE